MGQPLAHGRRAQRVLYCLIDGNTDFFTDERITFNRARQKQFFPRDELGAFVIAIDISTFNDINKFKNSVTEMCDQLRKQKPAPGHTQVLMPGDRSYARWEKVKQSGEVEVTQKSLDLISKLK